MSVVDIPETKFALSGELSIAYQVFGTGPRDLLYVPGIISHVDMQWEEAQAASFLKELAKRFRVIIFDKRGQGASDRIDGATTLEERIDDLRAVMSAAGSESATVFAVSEGGPVSILFASIYPDKVDRLILFGAMAKFWGDDEYPHMTHSRHMAKAIDQMVANWGTGEFVRRAAAVGSVSPAELLVFARRERMACSPSGIRKFLQANALIDVRALLPEVKQKTLVIQRRLDKIVPRENGRFLADHIPNAIYLELPTTSHLPQFEDSDLVIEAVSAFDNVADAPEVKPEDNRKLSVTLFTDIVGSTERLLSVGDEEWRKLLDQHDEIARSAVEKYKGRIVKNTGDGLLVIFDGPVRSLMCAQELIAALKAIGLPIRAGVHIGEVVNRGGDITGIAVNIASRVMDIAAEGEVLVTRTLKDLTGGSEMQFESAGTHTLKGLSDPYDLYRPLTL